MPDQGGKIEFGGPIELFSKAEMVWKIKQKCIVVFWLFLSPYFHKSDYTFYHYPLDNLPLIKC